MHVVSIFMNCIDAVASIRIFLAKDLRPAGNRATAEKMINEVIRRYAGAVPCLDPVKDMKVLFCGLCQPRSKMRHLTNFLQIGRGFKVESTLFTLT